jgi:hypothetical protein
MSQTIPCATHSLPQNAILTLPPDVSTILFKSTQGHLLAIKALSQFADVSENLCSLRVRANELGLPKLLKDERCFGVVGELCANVFYTSSPFGSKKIEPEAVLNGVGFRH